MNELEFGKFLTDGIIDEEYARFKENQKRDEKLKEIVANQKATLTSAPMLSNGAGLVGEHSAQNKLTAILSKLDNAKLIEFEAKARHAEALREIAEAETVVKLLESELKGYALETGEPIKAEWVEVSIVKGRESWDGRALGGLSLAFPEINECKKVGNPSTRIKYNL